MRAHNIGFDCLINEAFWNRKKQRVVYYIVDSEDGAVLKDGTIYELKEWWWKELADEREVGGYWLMSREEFMNAHTKGQFGKFKSPADVGKQEAGQQAGQQDRGEFSPAEWNRLASQEADLQAQAASRGYL